MTIVPPPTPWGDFGRAVLGGRSRLAIVVTALGWAVGCNAVWGLDPGAFTGAGGGGVGDGGGADASSTAAVGGGGGMAPCGATSSCPLGTPCSDARICASGHCADGVCCSSACDGECEACDLDARQGTCTPYSAGTDPEGECLVSADEVLRCNGMSACGGVHHFSGAYGGNNDDHARSVAADAMGALVVVGRFAGGLNFGGGNLSYNGNVDAFIAKLSTHGEHVWSQSFGSGGMDWLESVAIDNAGAIVATGRFRGNMNVDGTILSSAGETDVFVVKLSNAGDVLWATPFGGMDFDRGISVATDLQGNEIVAGVQTNVDFAGCNANSVENGIFVAKLNPDGICLWARSYAANKSYQGVGVAVDSMGEVLLTGSIEAATSFGGAVLTPEGGTDIFVAKLDAEGQHVWSNSFGGAAEEAGFDVAVDGDDRVLVTGMFASPSVAFGATETLSTAGGQDTFVLALDNNGVPLWAASYGAGADDAGYSIAADASGAVLVSGLFQATVDFGGGPLSSAGSTDLFALKLSADGTHVWSRRFGSSNDDGNIFVAPDPAGHVLLAGGFRGAADFGGPLLSSSGARDVFVLKLAP